jgi:zinc protease
MPMPAAAAPLAHREVLPNGVVLLVAERPDVPIVVARVFLKAGSVFDPADKGGLANLTGSLMTRGTAKRTGVQLDDAIEFVGGSLEAGAGRDGLTVSLSVLTRDLGLGLDLLAEVVLSPTFPEAELTRKVAQIQAAIKRSEEDPNTVAARVLAALVYPSHPYGKPVEGTIESVGKLTRDEVVAFHREYVRPDSAIVAVVGAITVDEARRQVLARFGGWTRPSPPPPAVGPAVASGQTVLLAGLISERRDNVQTTIPLLDQLGEEVDDVTDGAPGGTTVIHAGNVGKFSQLDELASGG